jgi:hypothetical protein
MISLLDIYIILDKANISIMLTNQQGMFRSEGVVNFIRRRVVNLPRRELVFLIGGGWSIYTGGDWLFIPAFPRL